MAGPETPAACAGAVSPSTAPAALATMAILRNVLWFIGFLASRPPPWWPVLSQPTPCAERHDTRIAGCLRGRDMLASSAQGRSTVLSSDHEQRPRRRR